MRNYLQISSSSNDELQQQHSTNAFAQSTPSIPANQDLSSTRPHHHSLQKTRDKKLVDKKARRPHSAVAGGGRLIHRRAARPESTAKCAVVMSGPATSVGSAYSTRLVASAKPSMSASRPACSIRWNTCARTTSPLKGCSPKCTSTWRTCGVWEHAVLSKEGRWVSSSLI